MVDRITNRCDIMLFGALGDLAQRKLFPAFYQLERADLLADDSRILALARQDIDTAIFRKQLLERLELCVKPEEFDRSVAEAFVQRFEYQILDFQDQEAFRVLNTWRDERTNELIVYMASPPAMYGVIARNLRSASCCTVQNLIALRFANNLFASQWDQNHISHVEITVAESVGIEGRWGYFDKAGQIRDMIQNHMLQLLCLIAMDPPSDLSADSIRDEKVKVLKALRAITPDMMESYVVRGQYTAGTSAGKPVPGYLEEEGANKRSETETFVALKVEIDNWRWSGVPFYIRTGKRLPEKLSQIIIHFKPAPHYIFDPDQRHLANNKLIIRLQPDEGMSLKILTKDQGLHKGMRLRQGPLELTFSETFEAERIPDAYERLLWEVMKGNQYLFVRRDEVEHAWRWVDQVIQNWNDGGDPPKRYAAGTWGPVASIAMITRDGRSWYEDA